jgi:DNA mismatch endonuclease (patch repair protein)
MMGTDVHSPETRSYNMSRIRGKDTKPEVKLRSLLHGEGYRFRLHDPRLPGKPDIVLPKYKTAIFVNGCFWHRHEGCRHSSMPQTRQDFWKKKFSGTVLRDRKKIQQLEESGWKALTIWECELKDEPQSVLSRLIKEFNKEVN